MKIVVAKTGIEATAPIAIPAALVAMKLHSIQDRTADMKRASDAWDLFRLLDRCNAGGEVAAALTAAPDGLAELVANALDAVFRSQVTRTRHWVRGYGAPEWAATLTDATMADAATALIEAIT